MKFLAVLLLLAYSLTVSCRRQQSLRAAADRCRSLPIIDSIVAADRCATSAAGKTFFTLDGRWGGIHKNFADAREECKKRGADLSTNLLEEDLKFIFNEARIVPHWISVYKVGARSNETKEANYEESFEWLDGTSLSARNPLWCKEFGDNPSDKCVAIVRKTDYCEEKTKRKGPAFRTVYCDATGAILCEIPNNESESDSDTDTD